MRIVIDYQGAQSGGSRNRGIGRYTSALTRSLIKLSEGDEIILLLNGAFADTVAPIREEYAGLLPQENIIVWHPLEPIGHIQRENDDRRKASELLREALIATLSPDALLITSHFEGSGDNGATTIGLLPRNYVTGIILYDLIPYIYRSIYLSAPVVERWYEERIGNLTRADLLLAISESSRQEAIDMLGFADRNAVNISTAADSHFRPLHLDGKDRADLLARYGITKPFVMYTGGIDHRKNIEGLIAAFAKLPKNVRRSHQLAVVCSIRNEDGPRLQELARSAGIEEGGLVLTGFVPEQDLVALYSICKLFVFPSWHEGFGLPALEAMHCGAPVIAGNRSSLPEVIGSEEALFDPRSEKSIREKMLEGLSDEAFRKRLVENGARRAAMFSWERVGKRALQAIRTAVAERKEPAEVEISGRRRPKMAMVTPLPPAHSGIADYAATLIRGLIRFYEIDVVLASGKTTDDPFILANCNILTDEEFHRAHQNYDRVVYHFGNSDHHNYIVDLLKEIPGIVVLHDFFVSDLSSWREHLGGVHGNWGYDLHESHGLGALIARHTNPDLFSVINTYPCSHSITRNAISVLCHSDEAKSLQIEWNGEEAARDWHVVPMVRHKPRLESRRQSREKLGLGADEFVVCAFGILGRSKLNHLLIEAWLGSRLARNRKCRLVFVGGFGPQDYHDELRAMVPAMSGAAQVNFTGWVEAEDYWRYLASADVAVQLRGLSHGETSAATLDAMMCGLPVIANNSAALPREGQDVLHLLPEEVTADDLKRALEKMFAEPEMRRQMGEAAENYARNRHSIENSTAVFASAVERSYCGPMATWKAGLERLAGLRLGAAEVQALAERFAAALDDRRVVHLDVTALLGRKKQSFREIEQVLRPLTEAYPTLPVYAVKRVGDRYASAMSDVLQSGLFPHVHEEPETLTPKSIDLLVVIAPDDVPFARLVAEERGCRLIVLDDSADERALVVAVREAEAASAALSSYSRRFSRPAMKADADALPEPQESARAGTRREEIFS
jgi:glycosyltransferase involved in cell wall biosynthesis